MRHLSVNPIKPGGFILCRNSIDPAAVAAPPVVHPYRACVVLRSRRGSVNAGWTPVTLQLDGRPRTTSLILSSFSCWHWISGDFCDWLFSKPCFNKISNKTELQLKPFLMEYFTPILSFNDLNPMCTWWCHLHSSELGIWSGKTNLGKNVGRWLCAGCTLYIWLRYIHFL